MAATILLDQFQLSIRCPEGYADTDAKLEALEEKVERAVDKAEDALRNLLEEIDESLKLEVER